MTQSEKGKTVCPSESELSAFYDGELGGPRAEEVAEHVRGCAACQRALREMGEMSSIVGAGPAGEMPAEAVRRLDRRVANLPAMRLWRLGAALSGLAAAILVAAAPRAIQVWRESRTPAQAASTNGARADAPAGWESVALADASGRQDWAGWVVSDLVKDDAHGGAVERKDGGVQ